MAPQSTSVPGFSTSGAHGNAGTWSPGAVPCVSCSGYDARRDPRIPLRTPRGFFHSSTPFLLSEHSWDISKTHLPLCVHALLRDVNAQGESAPPPPYPGTPEPVSIAWIQHALRLDDNPALHAAVSRGFPVVPVIFDCPTVVCPHMTTSSLESKSFCTCCNSNVESDWNMSVGAQQQQPQEHYRDRRFEGPWLAAVNDLETSLRLRGNDLIVLPPPTTPGAAAGALIDLCNQFGADRIYMHTAISREQLPLEKAVLDACEQSNVSAVTLSTGALFDPQQLMDPKLSFNSSALVPPNCDQFAERMRLVNVPKPLDAPLHIIPAKQLQYFQRRRRAASKSSTLEQCFGSLDASAQPEDADVYSETAAQAQMERFLSGQSLLVFRRDLNPTGIDKPHRPAASHKLQSITQSIMSFVELGCLSPRRMHFEIMKRLDDSSGRKLCMLMELFTREYRCYLDLRQQVEKRVVSADPKYLVR